MKKTEQMKEKERRNENKQITSKKTMNPKAILAVLVFSAFLALFNETVLNVALNILMKDLNVTAATVQWLVTAYMIVVSIMVPVTAFLIQTYEIKKLYLTAMGILLLGTACGACSVTFPMLLGSRMLQALGTGMMIPIMMNTVLHVTPQERRGSAMGICVCAIQLGPALGPTFAGTALQFFNWHALFIILLPLIIIAMIAGAIYLVDVATLTRPKLDIASVVLSTVGFGAVIYGLSSFTGSGDKRILMAIFAIGMVSLLVFVKRQLALNEPMLEMRTFKYPFFSIGIGLVMISMMSIFTMNVMLPMFLQGALGKTTFVSAMVLLPATLMNGAITLLSGKIYDKLGAKVLIPAGFTMILAALLILSRATVDTSLSAIVITYVVLCIGVGCAMSPSQTNALNQLPKSAYPHGVAILNTLQQISAAMGSSLFIGILAASEMKALRNSATEQGAVAAGFSTSVLAIAALIFVGLLLSFALVLEKKKLAADIHIDFFQ